MKIAQIIEQKLACLEPVELEIIDESSKHAGHKGHSGSGESHFKIRIVSDKFIGVSLLARHKMIYGLLTEEMAGGVHALAIRALTKNEVSST